MMRFKIMNEIMEIEQEIALKYQQINNRMKLLDQMHNMAPDPRLKDFLLRLQPEYPNKKCIEYQGPEPIPMRFGDLYDPIPMKMQEDYDPIPLQNL
jgi:hypothetical protein